ncbi:protein NRT1/ PTR FAMILY 3.1-like [Phalaenopsis equestris]|uniref:protein NRT1/ PTR FAMILY 3.1-like n=1 Tax=Phalaenopsis equestris TaxID=78828 RepID=UPI0009E18C87|nr:protein NRT1/ PTR FAMILY 3.1-like [Phalaenopsis equestris]
MADSGKKEKKKLGGMKTMPFILSNEVCDRFATAGFNANMVNYLRNELHVPLLQATNTLNNFAGTASLTPIVGALIADSFAGRFWTIAVGATLYQLGMLGVTISAILPSLRPPPCSPDFPSTCQEAAPWQQAIFYLSLMLTAVGSGGTRPCVVAFGAEQLEENDKSGRKSGSEESSGKGKPSFFNIYFFCIGLSVMLALTVVVYVQDNVGWGIGFGIPTVSMFISILVFIFGYPIYIRRKPGGSPMARVAQVVAAALRKRKLVVPTDGSVLYQNRELDADISTVGLLAHTKQFKFLDRAAIVANGDIDESSNRPISWRLSTVHRVEELKSILGILPIWSAGIFISTATSNNYTFGLVQAKSMDRQLASGFSIPPASFFIFSSASMLLTLTLYDRVIVPLARRLTGNPEGISQLRRIGMGLAIAVLSNVSAALIENRRRCAAGHISAFWLVPQCMVHGVSEGFASVGLMEFLYKQSPESMRSIAAALFWLSISLGHYGGTFLVTMVSDLTKRSGEGGWLQDDINEGRLDYYYWLVVGMQVFNLVYFIICAKSYVFKRLEVEEEGDAKLHLGDEDDHEDHPHVHAAVV